NHPRRRTPATRYHRHHPSNHRPRTSALNWPKSGKHPPGHDRKPGIRELGWLAERCDDKTPHGNRAGV
ncbi:hypothetical protein KPA07_04795, partial [Corynebacterium aurimucosum]|uniref:hypothetical protein n=1 Tax=Corynebacterium aurimucosum TaxID=169292 RepID=UPI001C0F286B